MSENTEPKSTLGRRDEPIQHTNRTFSFYRIMLFPDSYALDRVKKFLAEIPLKMNRERNWFTGEGPFVGYNWNSFLRYEKQDDELKTATVSLGEIRDKFGEVKEFFKPGSVVLDLGSGKGRVVEYISNKYPKVRTVGLDLRYIDEKATGKRGEHIAGSWNSMPFADNTFNRIMSCETFPAYWSSDNSKNVNAIKEITRVSQVGTIWRGTNRNAGGEIVALPMIDNGWDVYIHSRYPGLMIAQLKHK